MAFLPILMDIVDEINSNLDDPKGFSANIPLLFAPQAFNRGPTGRCKFPQGTRCPRTCFRRNCAAEPKTSEDFNVTIDVESFSPEEITVKVKDREILIEGKHDERQDEFGFVSRQFTRRFVLPEEFDIDTVSTFLNADGKMTIKASKPQPTVVEPLERVIPIQRVTTSSTSCSTSDHGKVEATTEETKDAEVEAQE